MKLKVISFLICVVLVFLSCAKKVSYPELNKNFSKTQIEDLKKIKTFFISNIMRSDNQNFLIAFDRFFSDNRLKGTNVINDQFKIEEFNKVLNSISKSTFNEIWDANYIEYSKHKSKYNWLAPKHNGKYQMFLKDISQKNVIIKNYYERMIATGDYNPAHFDESLIHSYNKMDYGNEQVQIIISVHYFSVIYEYLSNKKSSVE